MTDSANLNVSENTGKTFKRNLLLVIITGVLLFFPLLGKREIWTSGEARVAQVARQMIRSGDWVTPMIGREVRLHKPPMAYWLSAVAALPFDDIDEFNSRIPSALAGIGAMVIAYLFGLRLMSARAGLLSALALGTTGVFWWQARTTGIEMPLLFFNTLAIYAWWRYHEAETVLREEKSESAKQSRPWLMLCYFALAMSTLEKGPVGPVLILIIVGVYLGVSGKWRQGWPRITHHLVGLGILLLLSLPWYVAILQKVPHAWDEWFRQSAGRFEGFDHLNHSYFYFFGKILGDGQPWVLMALMLPLMLPGADDTRKRNIKFLLCWAGVSLIFFSIPASKKSYYIMPIYPALAIMAGCVFDELIRNAKALPLSKAFRPVMLFLAGVLIIAGLAAYPVFTLHLSKIKKFQHYAGHVTQLIIVSAICIAFGATLLHSAFKRNYRRTFTSIFAATVLSLCVYMSLMPDLNANKGDRAVCNHLIEHGVEENDRLYTYSMSGLPIIMFYTDHPVVRIGNEKEIMDALLEPDASKVYILMHTNDVERLSKETRSKLEPLGHPITGNNTIWLSSR